VGGAPGGSVELPPTAQVVSLPVGARVRLLHVPGRQVPAPLSAAEWEQGVDPPALSRPIGLYLAGAILLVSLVVALVALDAADPTTAELRTFLAGGWSGAGCAGRSRSSSPGTLHSPAPGR